jgi:hypothetical protein
MDHRVKPGGDDLRVCPFRDSHPPSLEPIHPPLLKPKQQTDRHAQRLLRLPVPGGDAVARIDEPPELPLLPRPDHEFERDAGADLAGARPGGPDAGLEFHGLRQLKRVTEQQIEIPIGVTAAGPNAEPP